MHVSSALFLLSSLTLWNHLPVAWGLPETRPVSWGLPETRPVSWGLPETRRFSSEQIGADPGPTSLEANVARLTQRLVRLEASQKLLTGQLEELTAENAALKARLTTSQQTATRTSSPRIAFHAWLQDSTLAGPYSRLILRDVLTNIGHAYNTSTGLFSAPVPGVYLFVVTTAANPLNTLPAGLQLVVDYKQVFYVSSRDPYHSDTCTNHVVMSLDAGQKVWLYATALTSVAGDHRTTFTGTLLFTNE